MLEEERTSPIVANDQDKPGTANDLPHETAEPRDSAASDCYANMVTSEVINICNNTLGKTVVIHYTDLLAALQEKYPDYAGEIGDLCELVVTEIAPEEYRSESYIVVDRECVERNYLVLS